jgi:hypothetical protein
MADSAKVNGVSCNLWHVATNEDNLETRWTHIVVRMQLVFYRSTHLTRVIVTLKY